MLAGTTGTREKSLAEKDEEFKLLLKYLRGWKKGVQAVKQKK